MSPHETLFLESTQSVDINLISNNNFVRFQTWDFAGDLNVLSEINYMGHKISLESILQNSRSVIYVIDAQEDNYFDHMPKLTEMIIACQNINPGINFEVFLVFII